MTSADERTQLERLLVVYRRVGEVLYGSVYPLRVDTTQTTGEIPLGKWEAPFVVSKQLGEHEIIYGSVLYHIHEAARPIIRMESHQRDLANSLPSELRASMVASRSGKQVIYTSPTIEFPAAFLHRRDEIIKDAVLLSALPMRTLLEMFSGKGNRLVPTYDYEGNPTGGVRLQRLFHALDHHRYCMISGEFVHDIFSDEDTPGLPNLFGTKIKVEDLLAAVFSFVEELTVNDLVGMLRGRLEKLTVDSAPRDVIFAHQNVYALTELVRPRLEDEAFSPFVNYLFSRFTVDESQEIEAAGDDTVVTLERLFTAPRFKLGPDLDTKVIEMSITINDKQEQFEFSLAEFFGQLTAACGKDQIISTERLRRRIEDLSCAG